MRRKGWVIELMSRKGRRGMRGFDDLKRLVNPLKGAVGYQMTWFAGDPFDVITRVGEEIQRWCYRDESEGGYFREEVSSLMLQRARDDHGIRARRPRRCRKTIGTR